MLEKRIKHQRIIIKQQTKDAALPSDSAPSFDQLNAAAVPVIQQELADEDQLQDTFKTVVSQKKRASQKPFDVNKPKKQRVAAQSTKDEANFINYVSKDHLTETG